MSETLTYDPTPEAEVLSADEQNSLEVGEQLIAEQEGLLAGKYKDARELEKAYVELQKKLGSPNRDEAEATEEVEEEVESEEEPEQDPTEAVTLITDASTEYAENGKLSEETMQKFQSMSSEELVNAYMEMSAKAPQQQQQEQGRELTDADVTNIRNSVGGDEAYSNIVTWAANNLDAASIEAYDNIVNSGDSKAIQLAVAGLKAQYEMTNGYEGEMLTGKAASKSSSTFRSQAELVEAMADPRYDRDPAYRNDILEKLERSDLNF